MNKRTILLGAASAVVLLVGVACGGNGDDEPAASSTPEVTATTAASTGATGTTGTTGATGGTGAATPEPTLVPAELSDEFREFAPQIAEAVANQDVDFFANHAWVELVTCRAEDVAVTGFLRACEAVGDEFQGMGLSVWGLEGGGLVPAQRVLALISSMWETSLADAPEDAFGGSEATVYALGANPRDGYAAQVAVITSQIERPSGMAGTGPLRVAVVTHWRFEEDDWRLFEVMQSVQFTEDLLEPSENGRLYIMDWEAYE